MKSPNAKDGCLETDVATASHVHRLGCIDMGNSGCFQKCRSGSSIR